MTDEKLIQAALAMLREDPAYEDDARQGVRVDNTIVGSILSITTGSPRWATERAVHTALVIIDRDRERKGGAE